MLHEVRDALAAPGLRRDRRVQAPLAVGRRPAARTATRPRSRARTRRRARARCRCSSTSASPARGTTCAPRARRPTLPLLAKGFFSTAGRTCATAREAGADAALLILRDLDDATRARAHGARGARSGSTRSSRRTTPSELDRAVALGAPVIGVNARDLGTFAIDRARPARARRARAARPDRDRRERRSTTRAQGAAAELAGADAVLVGSALMRAPDPGAKLAELLSRPLVKVCGLTRQEDVDAAVEAGADLVGFILAQESPRRAATLLDGAGDGARASPCSSARSRRRTPTSSSSTRARTATAPATPCCSAAASTVAHGRRPAVGARTTRRTSSAPARRRAA